MVIGFFAAIAVCFAVWLGPRLSAEVLIGKGRVLGPPRKAQVSLHGAPQPKAKVYRVPSSSTSSEQWVVHLPDTRWEFITIDGKAKDFGASLSRERDHHRFLGGVFLVQSEMGRRWKPFSYFGTATVTENAESIQAIAKGAETIDMMIVWKDPK